MEDGIHLPLSILRFMMLYFGIVPTWNVLWLSLLLLLALVTSLGVGLWLTALVLSLVLSSVACTEPGRSEGLSK